ncbi:hypothetical protein KC949_02625 [Candidatus Saccharibacteria bacterium]|nr:hypothetical protein [Candidatus Saccharibacteria bacterium]
MSEKLSISQQNQENIATLKSATDIRKELVQEERDTVAAAHRTVDALRSRPDGGAGATSGGQSVEDVTYNNLGDFQTKQFARIREAASQERAADANATAYANDHMEQLMKEAKSENRSRKIGAFFGRKKK